jgi:hypothetical protein
MPPLGTRIDEPEPVNDVVETSFEQDKQIGTRDAFLAIRFLKDKMKLFLRKAIHTLDFLLFAKLNAIIGQFSPTALTMFSRCIPAAIERAFVPVATVTFEEKL